MHSGLGRVHALGAACGHRWRDRGHIGEDEAWVTRKPFLYTASLWHRDSNPKTEKHISTSGRRKQSKRTQERRNTNERVPSVSFHSGILSLSHGTLHRLQRSARAFPNLLIHARTTNTSTT